MDHNTIDKRRFLAMAAAAATVPPAANAASSPWITPGERWADNRGKHIQAHGGGIIQFCGKFWWFGEDRSPGNAPNARFVAAYSSRDLASWRFEGQAFRLENPDGLGENFILERPKVYYNQATRTFVMYFHLDDTQPGGQGYKYARVGVATAKSINGPYSYVRSFRPLGKESRDIGQFIDDDGSAYLIFESRPSGGFYIASLSADYMSVMDEVAFIKAPLEGGAIVHYDGLYYALGSLLSGWAPNPNVYATATSLKGPWSTFVDIAPPETNTYTSQSSNLVKVVGSRHTSVIYVGDRWKPDDLTDSRYIWMPVEIGNGKMRLPEPRPWRIDMATGRVTVR